MIFNCIIIIIIMIICLLKHSTHKHTRELNNNRVSITNQGKRNKGLLESLIIYRLNAKMAA